MTPEKLKREGRRLVTARTVKAMMHNCSGIIDVRNAACAVAADRTREMAAIERDAAALGGVTYVNRVIASKIYAGAVTVQLSMPVVENFSRLHIELVMRTKKISRTKL